MRITIISHSLVHDRQRLFFDYMGRSDIKVQQVYPSTWGPLRRQGGFPVIFEGDIAHYAFTGETFNHIDEFHPDLIYYQGEWWSEQAKVSLQWAKLLGSKFAIFCWENIHPVQYDFHKEILRNADVVVCGNWEAVHIVKPYSKRIARIPQVGLDTDVLKPVDVEKKYDVLFKGRATPEKGIDYVTQVTQNLGLKLSLGEEYVEYRDLPRVYCSAKVFVMFSYATPDWKEQFNYAVIEALLCGLPVVASASGSMPEWFGQAPQVIFVRERDEAGLERVLKQVFSQPIPKSEMGREWVKHNFSKEVIAQQLLEVFERL